MKMEFSHLTLEELENIVFNNEELVMAYSQKRVEQNDIFIKDEEEFDRFILQQVVEEHKAM